MKRDPLHKIPGFPLYFTTENGDVYSAQTGKIKPLKQKLDKNGYPRVALYRNKKRKDLCVHIIQAMTFICFGEVPKNLQVNHLDGDKLNTHKDNFEVITQHKNNLHSMYELGNSTITYQEAKEIRSLRAEGAFTIKEIAEMYNCHRKVIEGVIYNQTWKPEKYEEK